MRSLHIIVGKRRRRNNKLAEANFPVSIQLSLIRRRNKLQPTGTVSVFRHVISVHKETPLSSATGSNPFTKPPHRSTPLTRHYLVTSVHVLSPPWFACAKSAESVIPATQTWAFKWIAMSHCWSSIDNKQFILLAKPVMDGTSRKTASPSSMMTIKSATRIQEFCWLWLSHFQNVFPSQWRYPTSRNVSSYISCDGCLAEGVGHLFLATEHRDEDDDETDYEGWKEQVNQQTSCSSLD